jgi:hypothetical protein
MKQLIISDYKYGVLIPTYSEVYNKQYDVIKFVNPFVQVSVLHILLFRYQIKMTATTSCNFVG